eukprot:1161890-Pelagomonas_calceolata.AAC.7
MGLLLWDDYRKQQGEEQQCCKKWITAVINIYKQVKAGGYNNEGARCALPERTYCHRKLLSSAAHPDVVHQAVCLLSDAGNGVQCAVCEAKHHPLRLQQCLCERNATSKQPSACPSSQPDAAALLPAQRIVGKDRHVRLTGPAPLTHPALWLSVPPWSPCRCSCACQPPAPQFVHVPPLPGKAFAGASTYSRWVSADLVQGSSSTVRSSKSPARYSSRKLSNVSVVVCSPVHRCRQLLRRCWGGQAWPGETDMLCFWSMAGVEASAPAFPRLNVRSAPPGGRPRSDIPFSRQTQIFQDCMSCASHPPTRLCKIWNSAFPAVSAATRSRKRSRTRLCNRAQETQQQEVRSVRQET